MISINRTLISALNYFIAVNIDNDMAAVVLIIISINIGVNNTKFRSSTNLPY